MTGALEGIRVLELSGLYGGYCGKLFADLGASVTLVEPPQGSPLRAKPPFVGDVPGPENSLPFAYFAANKASVVLDLRSTGGLERLSRLAHDADLLILSDHPDADRVDLPGLRADNPRIVCTRITPYGSSGPYSHYAGDDLTLMAMGGLLGLAGYPDRAPVVAFGEQGLLAADQFAAVASLAALLRAERSGTGELIDVSIQEAIVMALENAAQTYDLERRIRRRAAGERTCGSGIYPCKDGEIYLLAGGVGETSMWGNFGQWLAAEEVAGAETFTDPAWSGSADGAEETFARIFLPYAAQRTKEELYAKGRDWRVPVAPMSVPADLLDNRQLAHRDFFVTVPQGSPASGIRMPGAPYKMSASPWALRRPAPALAAEGASAPEYNA